MTLNKSRIRTFPESNYKAIYIDWKTLRIALDHNKPILPLQYPEFMDIKITDKCHGRCLYCYQDSLPNKGHCTDVVKKIKDYFGPMSENQRPFQVAIGGGEPTLHPDFIEVLKTFYDLGITPNYTTNGMLITEDIVQATEKYCGGIAITCHKHLENCWKTAIEKFSGKCKVNLHILISDKESIDYFLQIYQQYGGKIEYFVLLPYVAKGRAVPKEIDYEFLFKTLDRTNKKDLAFGAKFYDALKTRQDIKVDLYEPEIMSKYLDFMQGKLFDSSLN